MEEKGVWRTVKGHKVFIKDGETLSDALKRNYKSTLKGTKTLDGKTVKGYSEHYKQRKGERTTGHKNIKDALEKPLKYEEQENGCTKYIGKRATVVLSKNGTIVTVWNTKKRIRNKYVSK